MFAPPVTTPRVCYQRQTVTAPDGARLAVQSTGEGPAVLLANGIGVTVPGLDVIVGHLQGRHRCILWDYRGLGSSRLPVRRGSLGMAQHAADALTVLDALGEQRAVVLGWSMGVQVGLEIIRAAPERVVGFGALFGAWGQPFLHAFPAPVAHGLNLAVRGSHLAPWGNTALLKVGALLPPVAWFVCKGIGFVGPKADRELFHQDVSNVSRNDTRTYLRVLSELNRHDASDLLPWIRCPVLVATGSDDWVTPPEVGEKMAAAIPNATLLALPETSHFGVIEHRGALLGPIDALIARSYA